MKIQVNYLLIFAIFLFSFSCKEKKKEVPGNAILLNEGTVTAFARQIETSLQLSNPEFLNNAFDQAGIKQQLSDNSIVYSSLDAEFGKRYFDRYFLLGNRILQDLENGGDVKFLRYYSDAGKHHILLRTYVDFGIRIGDYIVDTVKGELKIVDGFLYHAGTTLVNYIRYGMLFDVLQQTNPEGSTSLLSEATQLLNAGNPNAARILLEKNKMVVSDYPDYTALLLRSVYESMPQQYMSLLSELKEEGWDERAFWLHAFLFHVHKGNTTEAEEAVDKLIGYTGDDPVYLYLFGLANYNSGDYEKALFCYDNAVSGMPVIWDIWFGRLQCFSKMKNVREFAETLESGKELYGMTDQELKELVKKRFPDMELYEKSLGQTKL